MVNPERGYFVFRDLLAMTELDQLRASGVSLLYGQVLLEKLSRPAAGQGGEGQAARGVLPRSARAGLKVLPRFYYAADDKAKDARPARALEHIAALTPLLQENADVIAAMHAGFVGAWGEWHPENRATMPERKQILDALLAALPDTRMIVVRRPYYKEVSYGGPVTAEQAFSAHPAGAHRAPQRLLPGQRQ